MLILTRRAGESIFIGNKQIIFKILETKGNQVRIGIEAPLDFCILREEIFERNEKQKSIAAKSRLKEYFINGTKVTYR